MKTMQKMKKNKGFTLVEVLVAIFILALGVLSALKFFAGAMVSTRYAEDLTVASIHAEYVLEEMKTKSTRAEITAIDWAVWAGSEGLNTLPSETLDINYPSGDSADPLEIQLTVSWVRDGRTSDVSLATQITE